MQRPVSRKQITTKPPLKPMLKGVGFFMLTGNGGFLFKE